MHQHNNTLRNSGAFKITSETKESTEIGAVVCPKCQHTFVKLVATGIASNEPVNWKNEAIQAGITLATAYIMFKVTSYLIVPADAFSSLSSIIQTSILLITILGLWFALPVMQYMRLYSTWLTFTYALVGTFAPIGLYQS
jgi:hypothetical protein